MVKTLQVLQVLSADKKRTHQWLECTVCTYVQVQCSLVVYTYIQLELGENRKYLQKYTTYKSLLATRPNNRQHKTRHMCPHECISVGCMIIFTKHRTVCNVLHTELL